MILLSFDSWITRRAVSRSAPARQTEVCPAWVGTNQCKFDRSPVGGECVDEVTRVSEETWWISCHYQAKMTGTPLETTECLGPTNMRSRVRNRTHGSVKGRGFGPSYSIKPKLINAVSLRPSSTFLRRADAFEKQ